MERIKEMYPYEYLNSDCEIEQLLYRICYHGAPTLSRLKPSSLICFNNSKKRDMKGMWDRHKVEIKHLIPFEYIELKRCDKGVNVLFFHRDWLKEIIAREDVQTFLQEQGYMECVDIEMALDILKAHYREGCPHEIGVFLGYPLSDVEAFVRREGQCIAVGYWRVYSNPQQAMQTFLSYDQARKWVNSHLLKGIKPSQLVDSSKYEQEAYAG